jgi:hypothetical protein
VKIHLAPLAAALVALSLTAGHAQAAARIPRPIERTVAKLQTEAARSDPALDIVKDLVTNVGPRQGATEQEARARAWAVDRLTAMGFKNVRVEPFTMTAWRRVKDEVTIVAPTTMKLSARALGYSASGKADAEIVRFASMAALKAAPEDAVRGKIVFIDERMERTPTGIGYAAAGLKRRECGPTTALKGGLACLIRTVGTTERFVNTGMMSRGGLMGALPAAAISNEESDALAAMLAKGPVRARVDIQTETISDAQSGNVIAEIPGRDKPDEIVLLGAHLDSWDITPGAQDDGAGVGVIMAVGNMIAKLPRHPKRTIRLVLFGAEEQGLLGAQAYAKAHEADLAKHVLGFEPDSGAGAIIGFATQFPPEKLAYGAAMRKAIGQKTGENDARGSSDVSVLAGRGVPVVDIRVDQSAYFDIHHTVQDTPDRIVPENLRAQTSAYATIAFIAAESGWVFR